ncbi:MULTISPECIES: ThiF family adenylyltransferase [unclassified Brevibacterium]|uniref:ThiF family adenylyltransferase n=1 Tax=unclassified Brevibacterium TaxID=2614124 RepID=UPI001E30435F|nr:MULTISPECIES: ThiF family adenylyltransferase [unclassified Brevibacterium]MCD1284743.1 molybdopterin biosynthesis protein [Brevibacterium sp. CCUG 69071]MDK8435636.1 ThiF family adenylyltransferase [Brevibacterium sp. H-BE7]
MSDQGHAADGRARYARQIRLAGFGAEAQRTLLNSHVLVIGAGGLGAPVLSYLTAAGVGRITVVDPDVVELSNLHRQVIHSEAGLGERKVDSARRHLQGLNSSIEIRTNPTLLTTDNALDLIGEADIVVDGSDNFATRYLSNDACEILGRPLVWGTILGFDGQLAVFDAAGGNATLRDLYPVVPAPGSVPDCATAGVLGPLCGSIGSAMAMETVKMLTGIGTPLINAVMVHSSLDASWERVPVGRNPARAAVTDLRDHRGDYDHLGEFDALTTEATTAAPEPTVAADPEAPTTNTPPNLGPAVIRWEQLEQDTVIIDIREDDEASAGRVPGAKHLPMDALLADPEPNLAHDHVALYCRSGVRSSTAAAQLRKRGYDVSSISGGYLAYLSRG